MPFIYQKTSADKKTLSADAFKERCVILVEKTSFQSKCHTCITFSQLTYITYRYLNYTSIYFSLGTFTTGKYYIDINKITKRQFLLLANYLCIHKDLIKNIDERTITTSYLNWFKMLK